MAGQQKHKKQKFTLEFCYFVVIQSICVVDNVVAYNDYQSQGHPSSAYIQTDRQLRLAAEEIQTPCNSDLLQHGLGGVGSLRFEPPLLDFHEHPVGMPHTERVTVVNNKLDEELHLLSISGSTSHFHSSFFQDKVVLPGHNTTFDVLFLARQEGNVENTLYIHTSKGSYKYQVFGVGIPNPYRIRPFLGAKLPINASFSPLISLYNPHSSTLQVTEIFSSGGDLHLELPTGEKETTQAFWQIKPYETKDVMRANFVGRSTDNHTAFIRIRTNREKRDSILVVPVEVEVTPEPGLYSTTELLDFGIILRHGRRSLPLRLLNSGPHSVEMVETEPYNQAISLNFRSVLVPSGVHEATQVATVTFEGGRAHSREHYSGSILVQSKSGLQSVFVPFQATLLQGSLEYSINDTRLLSGGPTMSLLVRQMSFTNGFNVGLVVNNVTLSGVPDGGGLDMKFLGSTVLKAKQKKPLLVFQFQNLYWAKFKAELRLFTNVSVFTIPIIVYTGQLNIVHHRPEMFKGQLDFGALKTNDTTSLSVTVRNDNPVPVKIKDVVCNLANSKVQLMGVEEGNHTLLKVDHPATEDVHVELPGGSFAVYTITVRSPDKEGSFASEVLFYTNYETKRLPISMRTASGGLKLANNRLFYNGAFPGFYLLWPVMLKSSFDHYMQVKKVFVHPLDGRFLWATSIGDRPPGPIVLDPHTTTRGGHVLFDAKRACGDDCYTGLPLHTEDGRLWAQGMTLDNVTADTDHYLLLKRRRQWQNLVLHNRHRINATLQVDLVKERGFLFETVVYLKWPTVVPHQMYIDFPLTQVGGLSVTYFLVENPGDEPVLMQIMLLCDYPNASTLKELSEEQIRRFVPRNRILQDDDPDLFILPDITFNDTDSVSKFNKGVADNFGVAPHHRTSTVFVAARTKVRFRVGFQPRTATKSHSLIVVRNNLTVVEVIPVSGEGARAELSFSLREKSPDAALMHFDITEKHLRHCEKNSSKKTPTTGKFSLRRSFSIKNSGDLPVTVKRFVINDRECEDLGFRVHKCASFKLQPDEGRKIDVTFTPDFSMSRISRTLTIYSTTGETFNYSLQATIPPSMMVKCALSLPRPPWEPVLYYTTLVVMGCLLICTIIASYFEADRLCGAEYWRRHLRTDDFDQSKIFNLNKLPSLDGKQQKMDRSAVSVKPQINSKSQPPPSQNNNRKHPEETPTAVSASRKKLMDRKWFKFSNVLISWPKFNWLSAILSWRRKSHHNTRSSSISSSNNVKSSSQLTEKRSNLVAKQPNGAVEQHFETVDKTNNNHVTKKSKRNATNNDVTLHDKRDNSKATDRKTQNFEHLGKNNASQGIAQEEDEWERQKSSKTKKQKAEKLPTANRRATSLPKSVPMASSSSRLKTDSGIEDRDDSSTTTDSSSLDPEPICHTPVENKSKKRQKDRKKKPEEPTTSVLKQGSAKKTKEKATAPVVLEYELPYSLPGEKNASERSSESVSGNGRSRKANKLKLKTKELDPISSHCHLPSPLPRDAAPATDSSTDSPPPQWDMPSLPRHVATDGDFSELSLQTHNMTQALRRGPMATALLPSSRSSSYSSVVSCGSSDRPTSPSGAKPNNFSPQHADVSKQNKTKPERPSPKWSLTPPPDLFGLQTINEQSRAPPAAALMQRRPQNIYAGPEEFAAATATEMDAASMGAFGQLAYGTGAKSAHQQLGGGMTFMQQLQLERRQKLLEYKQKQLLGQEEHWPMPNVRQESLWDSPQNWSASIAPSGATWEANPWGSNSPPCDPQQQQQQPWSTADDTTEGAIGYDPFRSMSDIWKPATSAGNDLWGSSFPPKPEND